MRRYLLRFFLGFFLFLLCVSVVFLGVAGATETNLQGSEGPKGNDKELPEAKAKPPNKRSRLLVPKIMPRLKSELESYFRQDFKKPIALFVEREFDEIYLLDAYFGEFFIFKLDLRPVARIGKDAELKRPIDFVVRDGNLYVTQDNVPYIQVLNYQGKPIKRIMPEGMEFLPGSIDIDEDGNIYVINKATTECVVFDVEDKVLRTIGDNLGSLSGVAVSKDRVYLVTPLDEKFEKIRVFSKDGQFIKALNVLSSDGTLFAVPRDAKSDPFGNIWTLDEFKGIVIFDRDGQWLGSLGDAQTKRERVRRAVDIDFDSAGMIYLIDASSKKIKIYK